MTVFCPAAAAAFSHIFDFHLLARKSVLRPFHTNNRKIAAMIFMQHIDFTNHRLVGHINIHFFILTGKLKMRLFIIALSTFLYIFA